ncbi:hypothetical protein [Amnibacterium kyonggiense]
MADHAVEVATELPSGYGPEATVRFFPEYSVLHPLWFWFGHPDLADVRLPAGLADRLRRWSAYWDGTFHWADGRPAGSPATWWTAEEQQLPRDVAVALGSDFVVEVDGRYLFSTAAAGSPTSAAALRALIDAEIEERHRIRARVAAGSRYDVVAGGVGFRARLARRGQGEGPAE